MNRHFASIKRVAASASGLRLKYESLIDGKLLKILPAISGELKKVQNCRYQQRNVLPGVIKEVKAQIRGSCHSALKMISI